MKNSLNSSRIYWAKLPRHLYRFKKPLRLILVLVSTQSHSYCWDLNFSNHLQTRLCPPPFWLFFKLILISCSLFLLLPHNSLLPQKWAKGGPYSRWSLSSPPSPSPILSPFSPPSPLPIPSPFFPPFLPFSMPATHTICLVQPLLGIVCSLYQSISVSIWNTFLGVALHLSHQWWCPQPQVNTHHCKEERKTKTLRWVEFRNKKYFLTNSILCVKCIHNSQQLKGWVHNHLSTCCSSTLRLVQFLFSFFLCIVMYDNEYKTKETRIKIIWTTAYNVNFNFGLIFIFVASCVGK